MPHSLYRPLAPTDLVDAEITELSPIPAEGNPYLHDPIRSGLGLPKGWEIMYETSKPGALEELILVNWKSGQRLKIDFTPKHLQLADIIESGKHRDKRAVSGVLYFAEMGDGDQILWKCVDDLDRSGIEEFLYALWWGERGMYFVKATLFVDTTKFPREFLTFSEDPKFDPNRMYPNDVARIQAMLDQYKPGEPPTTANNVTAKPFGLNE